jgi:glutathione S-transferase
MTIKLHGYPTGSFATQRTALIFHELGVPFEFVHVDLPSRAHKAPEYLDRHPFGQVPYIVRELHSIDDNKD